MGPEKVIAQVTGEDAQGRRDQEEATTVLVEAPEHVAGQVRTHQAGSPAQLVDGPLALRPTHLHRGEVEQVEPRRPPSGPPGQGGRALRRQRGVVHAAEQLLDLPRAEAQLIAVQLDQLARDQEPGGVDHRWPTAPQDDLDVSGPHGEERPEGPLGGRPGDLVEVIDDQLGRSRGGVQGADKVHDASSGGRRDEGVVGQGCAQRVPEMPRQIDLVRVLGAHAVPGAGTPTRSQVAEQGGLARTGRTQHQGHGHRPARARVQRRRPGFQTVPDQAPPVRPAELLQEDEGVHGSPVTLPSRPHPVGPGFCQPP